MSMSEKTCDRLVTVGQLSALAVLVLAFSLAALHHKDDGENTDAYILTKPGTFTALWGYKQLEMSECRWCGRTVNLNRHHVIPQSANPAMRDVKENLVVLCRDCHFVLGHRCNWKQYNPDVLYICTHFTNCIRSADTRYGITNVVVTPAPVARPIDASPILHVTNNVPERQRTALERILRWNQEGTNSLHFRPSEVR